MHQCWQKVFSDPSPHQDCNNGGICVAPDVCQCSRWDNDFRDGREGGGRPLFRKPDGDPQQTGWTGYDCSVPICVQVCARVCGVIGLYLVRIYGQQGKNTRMASKLVQTPGAWVFSHTHGELRAPIVLILISACLVLFATCQKTPDHCSTRCRGALLSKLRVLNGSH